MGIALKLERIAIIQVRETYSQLQGNNEKTGLPRDGQSLDPRITWSNIGRG